MVRRNFWRTTRGVVTGLGLFALPALASAQVSIAPDITFSDGLYHYAYSITNDGSLDLAIVTIQALPFPGAILNETAPDGFLTVFDSGPGLISFLEDADPATPGTFAPGSTVGKFTFASRYKPDVSVYSALDVQGSEFTGRTVGPTGVPEPGVVAFAVALLPGAAFVLRRRTLRSRTLQ